MNRIMVGQSHIDNMRRTLTKLEFIFDDKETPNPVDVSNLLVSLENSRSYLEADICNELGNCAQTAIDIDRLQAFESDNLREQLSGADWNRLQADLPMSEL